MSKKLAPEVEIKLLKSTVKAQAQMIINYRLGRTTAHEGMFEALRKAKEQYGDNLAKIK